MLLTKRAVHRIFHNIIFYNKKMETRKLARSIVFGCSFIVEVGICLAAVTFATGNIWYGIAAGFALLAIDSSRQR